MLTVVEYPTFQKQAAKIWSEDELWEFVSWIARNPEAGDVIPGAEGARKVRWSARGKGKRGGARVIYFSWSNQGFLELVAVYAKSDQENLAAAKIKRV